MEASREFKVTNTIWDQAQVTPKSLSALIQLESAQMLIPYWEKQTEKNVDTNSRYKYKALDCPYETLTEAIQSVKDKRQILIKWMFEVCASSNCDLTVLPHAIKILDRFLSCTPCSEKNLQAAGAACILLASKFRETTPLGIKRIAELTKGAATEMLLREVEMVVLLKLHWDIGCATYIEFLPFIFDILASNPEAQKLTELRHEDFRTYVSKYIDKLAALCYWLEPDLITKPPSVIAVQCVSVFFLKRGYLDTNVITRALHNYIPSLRVNSDMQACWDVANQVWSCFANETRSRPRAARSAPQFRKSSGPAGNQLRTVASSCALGPNCQCMPFKHAAVTEVAMDSGNYSGE